MFFQKLAALFVRYAATHFCASGKPRPCVDDTGKTIGYVDRISLHGQRLLIDGWADSTLVVITHGGARTELRPTLPRPDVVSAFPEISATAPGFAVELPFIGGPVTLQVVRKPNHFIHHLDLPDRANLFHAKSRLIWPFLRDLALATPTVLHWLATKDPADRTRFKRLLRLETLAPSQAMQSLLFIDDSLSHATAQQKTAELARLHPDELARLPITIVLPVFNALELLPNVLDRVLRHTDLPWRLILIDDASTDPAVRPFLRQWTAEQNPAGSDRITLVENAENLGFIRSVNAGLALALIFGNHVVLLNSDAFVPQAWASRLMRPFLLHDRVASVTPMSNDAEIFTAPVICSRGPLVHGQGDAIDAVAAQIHPDAGLAEAPTGVGFCMAMSINYLRLIPDLDTSFGRGYGEEVDWCQKARSLGGRHLGLANLFVEHRGGTSFGSTEKRLLVARNNTLISGRYPNYDADVQRFIANDPLAGSRLALAIAGAASQATTIPVFLAHSLGGGAEDYLSKRIADHLPNAAIVLRVGTRLRWQLELHCAQGITRGGTDDFSLIQRLLDPIKNFHIIYSCGVGDGDPVSLPQNLLALLRGPQDRIDMLVHDYFALSPSYTLLARNGRYLGVPDCASTDAAHSPTSATGERYSLADWRQAWGQLVANAGKITVFSKNSAENFLAAYPSARQKICLLPHTPLVDLLPIRHQARALTPVIGVLGNIGFHKGASVLQDLSLRVGRGSKAKLVVLGQVDPSYPLGPAAHIHGGYHRHQIPELAARYGITDWLIPSIWPETFSYTTHEAIATGLPVWGFDLGAQADAIRAHKMGGVVPIPGGVPDIDVLFSALIYPATSSESAAA